MGLLRWWRARKREMQAEDKALEDMRRADDVQAPEPPEAKLSQMRD
ncbi:MAG TPA: hypothetical protein VGH92_00360 [Gaiellaceae bacterium]